MKKRLTKKQPECGSCFGKGYATRMISYKTRYVKYPTTQVILCNCSRGQQLQRYFTIKRAYTGRFITNPPHGRPTRT